MMQRCVFAWVIGSVLFPWAGTVFAANSSWTSTAPTGLYSDGGNWDNGVPGPSDTGTFSVNGLTNQVNFTASASLGNLSFNATSATITQNIGAGNVWTINNAMSLSVSASRFNTVVLSSGSLLATNARIGVSGHGEFLVSAGATLQANALSLGVNGGSAGTLTVRGGTVETVGSGFANNLIGSGGAGALWVVDGGVFRHTNSTSQLFIGNFNTSAQVTVSNNSTFLSRNLFVGNSLARGTLTIAGGTAHLHGLLSVGDQNSATGAVWITNGGQLIVTNAGQNVTLGGNGGAPATGSLTVSNGALHAGSRVILGAVASSVGTLTVSGSASAAIITNAAGTATLDARRGAVQVDNGGSLQANFLVIGSAAVVTGHQATLNFGSVTNAGTFSAMHSVGTFTRQVVNNGAWITDPTTLTFHQTFSNAPNGFLQMAAGDVYRFRSNFLNQSTQAASYDTVAGRFVFEGGVAAVGTQVMQVAGVSLGAYGAVLSGAATNPVFFTHTDSQLYSTNAFAYVGEPIPGFTNNFALGSLEVRNNSTLLLADAFMGDGLTGGLYVTALTLEAGSRLIISNNVHLYFKGTNGVTGLAFGSWSDNAAANVLLLPGAGFHQLSVPEPSTLLLVTIGAVAFVRVWRRGCAP